jgi:cholesterol oxidase
MTPADAPSECFDAIVIGSGFGGAVSACRLAEAGLGVLVLERGMPYPPGAFPRTPRGMRSNFWDPPSGLHGLFDLWSFAHVTALVASGLGGGSLIYANVMLRKPRETFAWSDGTSDGDHRWPLDLDALAPHYDRVAKILCARPYPTEYEPYASTPKTVAFGEAAAATGLEVEHPPLAIAFGTGRARPEPGIPLPPDDNLHERPRYSCRLIGECDIGCNEGAKNTLDFNYLSAAKRANAQIRTCCEAVALAPVENGYQVRYLQHVTARGTHRADLLDPSMDVDRTVRAKLVVLAAGTFGSTRLLLGSRATLPGLSPALGRRYSSNGDMLSVARNCREPGGRRRDRRWRYLEPSRGPVITTSARPPLGNSDGRHMWIQDGGGPAISEWGWHPPEVPADLWAMRGVVLRRTLARLRRRRRTHLSGDVARVFGSGRSSAAMMVLLSLGCDVPGGRLRLRGDELELDWDPNDESRRYYDATQDVARRMARELGGRLGPRMLLRRSRALTVHPVGGCSMAADRSEGVVDTWGEVFDHRGLFVADGSVMPGPVGPNPSFTIAALADRFADRMIERANQDR